MLHFTKELRAGTPKIKDLKSIALNMGAAILNDIYGENEGTYYDYGLGEGSDEFDFNAKMKSLLQKGEELIPCYFKWFSVNRNKLVAESVIESARDGSGVNGMYYQNDIERIYSVWHCIQNFKRLDVLSVVENLQRLDQRQDAEEVRVLYEAGIYE